MSSQSQKPYDIYLGRKDIVLFAQSVLSTLYPTTASSLKQPFPAWLAYSLYRTMLPDGAVLHALHLLRRLSDSYGAAPDSREALFHHRLMTAALVLSAAYWMDDAYSNKSWTVATRSLFSVTDVDGMELELLRALDWRIIDRRTGETPESIVQLWDHERSLWRAAMSGRAPGGPSPSPAPAKKECSWDSIVPMPGAAFWTSLSHRQAVA